MDTGVLIGYFARREEARRVFKQLQKRRFHRAALVSKTADGQVETWDPLLSRRILGALLGFVLFGFVTALVVISLQWPEPIESGWRHFLLPILAGALTGVLVSEVWTRRSRYGVDRRLLEDHTRWLVANETVLIVQTTVKSLPLPVTLLRGSDESRHAIFVQHPERPKPSGQDWSPGTPLSPTQIQEHTRRLAADHAVDPRPQLNTALLDRLQSARQWISQVSSDLAEANRLQQSVPPTTEWLLDNGYIVASSARDVLRALPRKYYQELPALADGPCRSLPRIYALARELVAHTESRLNQGNLIAAIDAYQSVAQFTLGELWAIPQMLRIALIESIQQLSTRALTELRERELADFWANRLITAARRDPNQLFSILAELTENQTSPSPYFASQLIDHLYDEGAALVPVQSWLERSLRQSVNELQLREQSRQTKDQISMGNAFGSLRQLALLDWRLVFERLSRVEQMLRLDPAGVYPKMDFDTRDRYRRTVEELSRRSTLSEEKVTERALELAAQALRDAKDDDRASHVGAYLTGEGRRLLAQQIGARETVRYRTMQWVYRNHAAVYLLGTGSIALLVAALIVWFGLRTQPIWIQLFIGLVALFPASQLSLEVINYLITRFLPPRVLPKLDCSVSGIPDTFRTLIVVPTLLRNAESTRTDVEQLEIRYLANKEANLLFGLFTDYTDSKERQREDDESLLETAIEQIKELNDRYGGERFFLFHRHRSWSDGEQAFIGWERKRGKLEELNRLIDGTRPEDAERLVYVGHPGHLANVRFIITLDSDTQLPRGAARRMIETLAHPLNQPRFDAHGNVETGSYTLIQPRVTPSLPSASASPFSRLFADAIGVDPYTQAVSDAHQDLTGEGSYHGKGIYDVRAFSRILSGRFPDELLLSHDLIEGAHIRVGLASDIELFDEFPQDYLTYSKRQHRWIRGDWQIADWMLPWVPRAGGGRGPNPLSWFNRGKIADNLRRSLVPAASIALLVASWLMAPQMAWMATLLVALPLVFHPLAQPITMATTRDGLRTFSVAKVRHDLQRAIVDAALLPHQAGLALDAIVRVWYRRLISHRRLLNWVTAHTSAARDRRPAWIMQSLGLAILLAGLMAWAVLRWSPASFNWAVAWLVLWLISPVLGILLTRPSRTPQKRAHLSSADHRFLRTVARRTWRYFADFVNEDSAWLPPDNYQVSHQNRLALRTSPTNIGVWMVSALAANDFGYLTPDQVVDRLTRTMETIDRLDRHEGHLLNWYDLETLQPLEPRYVSAVDSGNLLGSLWSLQHGLDELMSSPVLDQRALDGLKDTGDVLLETHDQDSTDRAIDPAFPALVRTLAQPSTGIADTLRLLRKLAGTSEPPGGASRSTDYWSAQIRSQFAAWQKIADRYLGWIEILEGFEADELAAPGWEGLQAYRRDLRQAPSLAEMARGQVVCIRIIQDIREASPITTTSHRERLDRLDQALEQSRACATEVLESCTQLRDRVRELCEAMNMRFLYDLERRLFSVGFNVSEGRLDNAHYDLLASEARFGSYVAIARGDVPTEHWFSMNRPYNAIGRRRLLLSWTGTMFEYLMPLIFQRSYEHSLLDQAVQEAVAVQMDYGRRRMVPWGISESAYGDLDINQTYQYKAFGVPQLGLKRGLITELVVAPYATLLAVNVRPRQTVRNLRRLAGLGLLNEYGYYESIDFSRRPSREGDRGVIVRAYMAHHHGMSFLALTNFLHDDAIQRRFHTDPRVRAVESLLHERIPIRPPLLEHISTRETAPWVATAGEVAPSASQFTTPHTLTPKTQLLCNGRYGLMITNTGGGYSQWNGSEITRWRSDRTADSWGTFCYIHEADTDHYWSTTYQPVGGEIEEYSVGMALDRAVFRRLDHGIRTEMEVVVSPEDDVEIRRITLVNRSSQFRHLQLTSYVELALAPHTADRQHPAFSKLFIQTEAIPETRTLLAHRRPRNEDEPPIFVAHRWTHDLHEEGPFQFETDRRRFIGRGRTAERPMGAFQEPTNCDGFVLDPILSLRQTVLLEPGERTQLTLVLAAGETREDVLRLVDQYGDPHAIDRALDFAWASSQLELRLLRIQPDDARRFQQMASHLLYPNPLLRPPPESIEQNHRGQSGLWAYGISGDLPIALITIGDARDITLVRQMLQAHAYWRRHGLTADLVILNEEAAGYEQPLRERLERLIQTHAMFTGTDQPGGVFLRSAELIPEEDLALLKAAASVMMVAARGTLPRQLGLAPEVPEPMVRKRAVREPSPSLPFLDLPYFNSLGGFTPDGREYAVYLGPHTHTPAPWVNVIANPNFGTVISETGAGFTWFGNSQRNRLTPWSNDPVVDPPSEVIYLRDEETGVYWTPTAAPIREETPYRARHGAGYTVFEHNSQGIEQQLTVFVPMDDNGGLPVKVQRLKLRNDSSRPRRLSITYYVEWALGEHRESSQMHVITSWDEEAQALLARNRYHPDRGDRVSFAAINTPADSYSGDRTAFLGRNRSLSNPAAMDHVKLSGRTGAGFDPCGAIQVAFELAPGESREITCLLGQADSVDAARDLVNGFWDQLTLETAQQKTIEWWDRLLGTVEVDTPELATNFLVNRWLRYQSLSCRIWGRSAVYQSGGAYGFRDQLQDVMAFLHGYPELARDQILLAASRQFKEGDVQHWWHPEDGTGVRTRISDDLLWLPYVVTQYVRTTGDADILHTMVPFLDAPLLEEDQHEVIVTPDISSERGTIFEHCQRAVSRSLAFGPHGLPLIGTGDWNDGMNRVGVGGKGESVWLAWFLIDVLGGMAELAERLGESKLVDRYRKELAALSKRVEHAAWDGAWYLRAIFDDGTPLGSEQSEEAKIDSLPQSWAQLCGAADPERTGQALESAWQHLVREDEGLVLLFDPPFENAVPSPGYIKGYPPGVRENGGQYTHAALWFAMAMARRGDGTRAAGMLRLLNPVERARNPESVWRYGLEPYVVAADIYRLPDRIGHGGWSWYTGAASWMYRAWVEEVLGLKVRGEQMQVSPVIPSSWEGFDLRYRHGEAVYEIRVDNPDGCEQGVAWVEMDGKRLPDGVIPLFRDLVKYRVVVRMGEPDRIDPVSP